MIISIIIFIRGILWGLFMSKKLSLPGLRMLLRRENRNYLGYLEHNRGDVELYCRNLCGMNPNEAEKAYRTLLNDEIEDSSGGRGKSSHIRSGRRRCFT